MQEYSFIKRFGRFLGDGLGKVYQACKAFCWLRFSGFMACRVCTGFRTLGKGGSGA